MTSIDRTILVPDDIDTCCVIAYGRCRTAQRAMPRERQALRDAVLVWGLVLLALGVFGSACFGLLRVTTALPVWIAVLISAPVAVGAFVLFAWTHQTNGFDGPMISMDEFRSKMATMTPEQQSKYLAEFSATDREILERKLRNGGD
jgi:hypothetical protein